VINTHNPFSQEFTAEMFKQAFPAITSYGPPKVCLVGLFFTADIFLLVNLHLYQIVYPTLEDQSDQIQPIFINKERERKML